MNDQTANHITYEERSRVYERARQTFGEPQQIVVAIEEMSEVIKALTKWLRKDIDGDDALASIIEEVTDATIMLEQIRIIFNINDAVCDAMDSKIHRLESRIAEEDAFSAV